MFIKFFLPRVSLIKRYPFKISKVNYSTDLPVNNVKNIKLYNFLMKYKFVQSMYANPKYSHFFQDLFNSSTKTVIITFMILHELTATIPFIGIWYFLYQNGNDLKDKFNSIKQNSNDDKSDITEKSKIAQFMDEKMAKFEKSVNRFITKFIDTKPFDADELKLMTMTGVVSYTAVKIMAPVRIMVSVLCTPKVARFFQKGFNLIFK
ncbi:hypothetical protein FOG48_02831 [Hanseniaspora uvarum]|nr:hypothetical protein FOG48_02831 [Hanseniaspora uvarum]